MAPEERVKEERNSRRESAPVCEVCDHPESKVGPLSQNSKRSFVCDECAEEER